jgi:mono/diheme cytochrome c family protein
MRRAALAALVLLCAAAPALADDPVAAGKYQAILGDCQGCHTAPGGKPFAGGLVLETPFGKLAASNITMDRATGIGDWSQADFRRAMQQGIAPGGKRLYPAMPYPNYARMRDSDIAALWAYMKTVAPVRHAVKTNLLPFPYNIRLGMMVWNWINFRPRVFAPDPGRSAAWNRGAYLVRGAAHCGVCHTPKTMLGADKTGKRFAGASLQGWFAPDLTANRTVGIGDWTQDDIVAYLKTGWNAHAVASGPMAEAVENSTSRMTDADLTAIAVYLKALPASPRAATPAIAASDVRMRAGAAVYEANCTACHGWDGKGEGLLFPPLARNPIVQQDSAETLIRVVLAGARAVQTQGAPTAPAMPSFAWRLDDRQVADMLTYIRNAWGNEAAPVSADSVAALRGRLRRSPAD